MANQAQKEPRGELKDHKKEELARRLLELRKKKEAVLLPRTNVSQGKSVARAKVVRKKKGLKFPHLTFFPAEEHVAGLTVSAEAVRLLLLRPGSPESPTVRIAAQAEVPLPPGTLESGRVRDLTALIAALKQLRQEGPTTPFVILSVQLSDIDTWGSVFIFPKRLRPDQLKDAMDLQSRFSIPFLQDTAFTDWEEIPSYDPDRHEVLLVAARKEVVKPYLEALEAAGFTAVACEIFPLSIARAVRQDPSGFLASFFFFSDLATLTVIARNAVRFMRTFTPDSQDTQGIFWELVKFWHFAVSEGLETAVPPFSPLFLGNENVGIELAPLVEEELGIALLVESSPWAVTLGSARRGLVPRHSDTRISFMPIGTEEAYAQKRMLLFAEFIGNFAVGVAVLLALLFGATFGIFVRQEQDAKLALDRVPRVAERTAEMTQAAGEFNALVSTISSVEMRVLRWENLFEKIRTITNPGITVTHIAMAGGEGNLTIAGRAKTRSALQQFKNDLEQQGLGAGIALPFTTIDKGEDIQFTFPFVLQDTAILSRQEP